MENAEAMCKVTIKDIVMDEEPHDKVALGQNFANAVLIVGQNFGKADIMIQAEDTWTVH